MSLYNRGTSYYAVLNVPTAFRSLVGKRQLRVSLWDTDWGEYRFFSDVVKNAVKTRYDIGRIGGGVQQPEFPQEQIRRFQKPCQQENPYFTRDLRQR